MSQPVTIIKSKSPLSLGLNEIWRYRELFYIFAWRDLKVRYKQTFLGIAWAVFQPLVTMVIFTFFFGKLAQIPSGNLPYPLFVFVGLTIWTFFANAVTSASNSLIEHQQIIKKVYFPRIIIPLAAIVTSSVDFGITLIFLLVMLLYFQTLPHPLILALLPLLLLILILTAAGLSLFLSAFNVKYRDVRYILPFFIRILMFLTPVIYPSTLIASQHKWVININPLTSVIEIARELISGHTLINWSLLGLSLVSAITLFIFGLFYFRKTEKFFADIV